MFKAEHSQIRAERYSTMAELTVTYLSLSACKESRVQ